MPREEKITLRIDAVEATEKADLPLVRPVGRHLSKPVNTNTIAVIDRTACV